MHDDCEVLSPSHGRVKSVGKGPHGGCAHLKYFPAYRSLSNVVIVCHLSFLHTSYSQYREHCHGVAPATRGDGARPLSRKGGAARARKGSAAGSSARIPEPGGASDRAGWLAGQPPRERSVGSAARYPAAAAMRPRTTWRDAGAGASDPVSCRPIGRAAWAR
jgi:hypothetical protein